MDLESKYHLLRAIMSRLLERSRAASIESPSTLDLDDALLELEAWRCLITGSVDDSHGHLVTGDPEYIRLAALAMDSAVAACDDLEKDTDFPQPGRQEQERITSKVLDITSTLFRITEVTSPTPHLTWQTEELHRVLTERSNNAPTGDETVAIEVISIVASLVSAFHGGAELIKLYPKRRAKKREKHQQHKRELHEVEAQDQVLQDMLHTSLEESGTLVSRQFLDEQRALGEYSQLLRSGDDRAKQELLMIAVSLQAEVIASLGRAQENLQVIVDMAQLKTLHEVTITKRYEATRSISELRQRIEMILPLPQLSPDLASGTSISQRNSNESLAKTFVTAAANLFISEPTAQRLLTMPPIPPIPGRQQSQLRRPGPSIRTLSSFQYLIPEIRAQDIDILTLAGYDTNHENGSETATSAIRNLPQLSLPNSNTSSSSQMTSVSRPLAQSFGKAGPYFPPRTLSKDTGRLGHGQFAPLEAIPSHSTRSDAPEIVRAFSTPADLSSAAMFPEPDGDITSELRPDDHLPYCTGALAAQKDFGASFTRQQLPILPGSQKLHPTWKCSACDFNASDGDGRLLQRIEFAHGVRYRFPFCARSHAPYTQPPDAFRPRYTYGCLFCTAEGRTSVIHVGSDALMAHIAMNHRTNLTPEVRTRTHSVVGRLASRDEGWDVNLPDASSKSGSGVGRWLLHAFTSLPT